jgi:hypothetical protein
VVAIVAGVQIRADPGILANSEIETQHEMHLSDQLGLRGKTCETREIFENQETGKYGGRRMFEDRIAAIVVIEIMKFNQKVVTRSSLALAKLGDQSQIDNRPDVMSIPREPRGEMNHQGPTVVFDLTQKTAMESDAIQGANEMTNAKNLLKVLIGQNDQPINHDGICFIKVLHAVLKSQRMDD